MQLKNQSKRYIITKFVNAVDIDDALKKEKKQKVCSIILDYEYEDEKERIRDENKITGFKK